MAVHCRDTVLLPARCAKWSQGSSCGPSRWPLPRQVAVGVSSHQDPIGSYPYQSSDGTVKQKATIEQVFGPLQGVAPPANLGSSPWSIGWQASERSMLWNDELKVRLVKRIAQEQLGISEGEMEWRLTQVDAVLPGLAHRLQQAPPALVARVAAHTEDIAARLVLLKAAFPGADVGTMVNNRLSLLLDDDITQITQAATRLRALLPGVQVDRLVADYPLVLDVECLERALEDCKRLMPGQDPVLLLRSNPALVMGMVKGKALIPYDQVANPWS